VVWGPGLTNAAAIGTVNRTSVMAAIDLVPSVLAMTGVAVPDGIGFDGEPVADVLLGKSKRSRSQPLFFRRPPDRDSFYGVKDLPDLAVRQGQWKLLCEYDGTNQQLYDVIADPGETKNVAKKHKDIARRLADIVVAWHRRMPPDNGAIYGDLK